MSGDICDVLKCTSSLHEFTLRIIIDTIYSIECLWYSIQDGFWTPLVVLLRTMNDAQSFNRLAKDFYQHNR